MCAVAFLLSISLHLFALSIFPLAFSVSGSYWARGRWKDVEREEEARGRVLMFCCSCVLKEGSSFINSLTGCCAHSSGFYLDCLLLGVRAHTVDGAHAHAHIRTSFFCASARAQTNTFTRQKSAVTQNKYWQIYPAGLFIFNSWLIPQSISFLEN